MTLHHSSRAEGTRPSDRNPHTRSGPAGGNRPLPAPGIRGEASGRREASLGKTKKSGSCRRKSQEIAGSVENSLPAGQRCGSCPPPGSVGQDVPAAALSHEEIRQQFGFQSPGTSSGDRAGLQWKGSPGTGGQGTFIRYVPVYGFPDTAYPLYLNPVIASRTREDQKTSITALKEHSACENRTFERSSRDIGDFGRVCDPALPSVPWREKEDVFTRRSPAVLPTDRAGLQWKLGLVAPYKASYPLFLPIYGFPGDVSPLYLNPGVASRTTNEEKGRTHLLERLSGHEKTCLHRRGRQVEYLARDLLLSHGYTAMRVSLPRQPIDLIAWNRGSVLLIGVTRTRKPVTDARAAIDSCVARVRSLAKVVPPRCGSVHLWFFSARCGWRFYSVHKNGLMEVPEDAWA